MRAAQEMPAGANLADRRHRLAVVVHHDALRQVVQRAQLVGVHHELLIAADQPAL